MENLAYYCFNVNYSLCVVSTKVPQTAITRQNNPAQGRIQKKLSQSEKGVCTLGHLTLLLALLRKGSKEVVHLKENMIQAPWENIHPLCKDETLPFATKMNRSKRHFVL